MSFRRCRAIYLTHPEVDIDPEIPVGQWHLSETGLARTAALAARMGRLRRTRVISSSETKAIETSAPLAECCGHPAIIAADMHENDRSATGYLPQMEFEATADAFFAAPDRSVRGWETARDAQARIVAAVMAAITDHPDVNLVFSGHGAVGTLLYCHLAGLDIDRRWDQPGAGHWFAFDLDTLRPLACWAPMESLTAM